MKRHLPKKITSRRKEEKVKGLRMRWNGGSWRDHGHQEEDGAGEVGGVADKFIR